VKKRAEGEELLKITSLFKKTEHGLCRMGGNAKKGGLGGKIRREIGVRTKRTGGRRGSTEFKSLVFANF